MGLRPPKVMKSWKIKITGRLRSRLGKRVLPRRDRQGVGAVAVNRGLASSTEWPWARWPTKGNED